MTKQEDFLEPEKMSFVVLTSEEHNRVELHIRGPIIGAESIGEQLSTLYHLSEKYDTLLMYLNTPGGSVATMVEVLAIMDKFSTVITVAVGQTASAGFTLWCAGDVRVVQSYTSLMAHREAYGHQGKTDQNLDLANHTNSVYGGMMVDICGSFLTPEELERTKYTEVFLTCEQMIDRGLAISWKQFVTADSQVYEMTSMVNIHGIQYQMIGNNQVMTYDGEGNSIIQGFYDLIYNVPNPAKIVISEEDEVETE